MKLQSDTDSSKIDGGDTSHSAAAPTIGQAVMPRPRFDAATKELVVPTPFEGGFLRFDLAERTLNREQMAVLGPARIKPDFDPAYVAAFLADCHARGLDPWSGEVYLMRYKTSDGPQYVRHIGIYGFLRVAEESGCFRGMEQVLFQGPDDDRWVEVWKYKDVPPFAAKAVSHRTDGRLPSPVVANFDEYAPLVDEVIKERKPNGNIKTIYTGRKVWAPMWRPAAEGGKATVMISKCGRSASLRLLFPRRFGGFYEPAELEKTVTEFRGAPAGYDDGETATARRAAYEQAQRTVDGAEVGATVRETITIHDQADTQDQRALLLAELDAQARLLGQDREWMTRRWSAARGGQAFETASVATMIGHVHRYRPYVIDRLRETGRHRLAERYNTAPTVGTLEVLFGTVRPWDTPAEVAHPGDGGKTAAGDVAAEIPEVPGGGDQ